MAAKVPKFTREWLMEALKLSLSSLRRGEPETAVLVRLRGAIDAYLERLR